MEGNTDEMPEYMVMGKSVEYQTPDSDSECFRRVKGEEMIDSIFWSGKGTKFVMKFEFQLGEDTNSSINVC